MAHHPHGSRHVHASRPIDRGELGGLPALPEDVDEPDDPVLHRDPALIEAGLRGHAAVPRALRFTLEGMAIVVLSSVLAWLVLDSSGRHGPAVRCPPNISPAVQAATACTAAAEAGDE